MTKDFSQIDLVAAISHDIRTPMNGVVGMTELLMSSGLSPQQQHYARTIMSSADAKLRLVNDILDLSKIEAKGFTRRPHKAHLIGSSPISATNSNIL